MDMALSKWLYLILTFLFFTPITVALNPYLNTQELSQIPLKFLNLAKKPELVNYIINIRRRIHECPELGFEEFETSKLIRSELDKLGIAYKHPVAITGIVGYIGKGDPPFVALRADMDALAIEEDLEWEFKSKVPGKMHACGHDGHVAMLLGAAKMLQEHSHDLKGTIVLVFQPAEEGGGGAKKMVEAGILENVSAIFGIHLSGRIPLGRVAGKAGTTLAGGGFFEAVISGKGGHAAIPQHTIDPVLAASNVILSLQHLVSRETDPLDSQVVTIAKFQGGGALNVIPDSVTIGGTFRAFSKEGLIQLKRRIEEVITKQATVQRCNATVNFDGENMSFYIPTVNDIDLHEFFVDVAADMAGVKNVLEAKLVMGSEDFAFFADVIPGYFYWIGMQNETEGPLGMAHTPYYKMNEDALSYGAALNAALATRYLFKLQSGSKYQQGDIREEL